MTTPWNPLLLDPELWLDGADDDTITIDTGVSEWADKSGNGNDYVQAAGGSQPPLSSINSVQALNFSGEFLTGPAITDAWTDSKMTMFMVVCPRTLRTGSPAYHTLWTKGDVNTHDIYWALNATTGSNTTLRMNDNAATFTGTDSIANNSPLIAAFSGVSGSQTLYVDGGAVHTFATETTNWVALMGNTASTLGTEALGRTLEGDIGEVLIFNRLLSLVDMQRVEGYLAWKWGLEGNLAADHLFKSAAPVEFELVENAWTPSELTTELWLEGTDPDSIVLEYLNRVERWVDKSGNGHDYTQDGAYTDRPNPSSLNALPCINFSGEYLIGPNIIGSGATPDLSMFAVVVPRTLRTGAPLYHTIFMQGESVNDNDFYWGVKATGSPLFRIGDTEVAGDSTTTDDIPMILGVVGDNTAQVQHVDGIEASATTITTLWEPIAGTDTTFLGTDNDTRTFEGDIAEVIIINSVLSVYYRQRVEGYLAWKWGLVDNLAADHPYKSVPPLISVTPPSTGGLDVLIGSAAIEEIYLGSAQIDSAYVGSEKIG